MAKELYLYTGIYSYTAQTLIAAINDVMSKPADLRVNSQGGDVFAFWGIAAKMTEHGNITLKYDGVGFSSAANLSLYAKKVIALKESKFLFHRADGYAETEQDKKLLAEVNTDLRSRMEARVNADKFKAITGYTIAQMFDPEQRINIFLSADQMKQLGLVDEVRDIDPVEINAFNERFFKVAAEHVPPVQNPNQNITMNTLAELKEKFPAIYALAIEEGKKVGIEAENDRIGAVMVFAHLDFEGCKKIIASGKPMTATQQAEFALKAASPEALVKLKENTQKDVATDDTGAILTAEQKKAIEVETFTKGIRAELGLDKTDKKVGNVTLVTN